MKPANSERPARDPLLRLIGAFAAIVAAVAIVVALFWLILRFPRF